MRRIAALAVVSTLFLVGLAIGVLGTHLFYAHRLQAPGVGPGMAGRFFADRLEHRLDLSPEQKREIDRILDESRLRAEDLRREMAPRVRELMTETTERMEGVLTPEQRREFERLRRERRIGAEHFLLGPPGRHGPHRRPPPRRPPPPN